MKELIKIASEIRSELEIWVSFHNKKKRIKYKSYKNPYPRLTGLCGVASSLFSLRTNLPMVYGMYSDKRFYEPHYWNLISYNNINLFLDITATQFRHPEKIFICPFDYPSYKLIEVANNIFTDGSVHPACKWWLQVHKELKLFNK